MSHERFDHSENVFQFRYEDYAADQMKIASQVYSFLGVEMHQSVRSWIESRLADKTDNNPYSTHRNSTNAATKWRNNIPFTDVTNIQLLCESAMRKAGYQFVSNEAELRDHSFELIDPWFDNRIA